MKPAVTKKPRLMKTLGLTLLAVVVFLLSIWLLFPYDAVERRVNQELAARSIDAEITGLGPRTPFSYKIKTIRVTKLMGKEANLRLNDAIVYVKPSMLLDGIIGLNVTGEIFGGTVKADLIAPKPESIDLAWENISLADIMPLVSEKEIPLVGKTTGSGVLLLPFDLMKLDARVDATISDFTVGQVNAMGFALGPIALGNGRVRADADKGRVRISEATLRDGDIDVTGDGAITLTTPFGRSPLEGTVRIKPTPKAEGEYFIAFSMLSQFKQPDGSYLMKLSGTPSTPQAR